MSTLRVRRLTVGVVGLCVALALGLAWAARSVNDHSNERLLEQQVQQAAAALSSSMPITQAQLAQVMQVAVNTNADPQIFKRAVAPVLSKHPEMAGISLWRVAQGEQPQELANAGGALALVSQDKALGFLSGLRPNSDHLALTGILPGTPARLGFAQTAPDSSTGLVIYGESALPADRRVKIPKSSPFADLDVALYLGSKPVEAQLLEATAPTPIHGRTAQASLPFGDTSITLVGSPRSDLAGALSASLWWIVLVVGGGLALAGGATVEYIARRRAVAEGLARDNDRLYREQRDIAGTLQHALLPDVPDIDGLEISARYLAGVAGIEVGGDWYDVICPDKNRVVFFVGDVSGRGLPAATTMASLRFASRAYIAQGDSIETVLLKLGELLETEADQHFATVLAGDIDLRDRRLSLASAGHFAPLLITDAAAEFVAAGAQPPVGVAAPTLPMTVSFDVPANATLLAFTDGAVERRGESIDDGLQRLRDAAATDGRPLDELLDGLIAALVPGGADDDVVLLAIRWSD